MVITTTTTKQLQSFWELCRQDGDISTQIDKVRKNIEEHFMAMNTQALGKIKMTIITEYVSDSNNTTTI